MRVINFDDDIEYAQDLRGKGRSLCDMAHIFCNNTDIKVSQGFVLPPELCQYYMHHNALPNDFEKALCDSVATLRKHEGILLVSVRSGAAVSMPGMMDSVLNVGMNSDVAKEVRKTHGERFALDCYRRFMQMFAVIVLKYDEDIFNSILSKYADLSDVTALHSVVSEFERIVQDAIPNVFEEQLKMAIVSVLESWNNDRAKQYRRMYDISDDMGTSVIVQQMVFGNMNANSATGVMFSRDPSTGEPGIFGEYLLNAQGEDVVAGSITPLAMRGTENSMEMLYPHWYKKAMFCAKTLEKHYCDMQDIEFTIENGNFYVLQTRSGKRTAIAAIKIAHDMYHEKRCTLNQAVHMLQKVDLNDIMHSHIMTDCSNKFLTAGLAASPGVGVGAIVLAKEKLKYYGSRSILVRRETDPDDVIAMSEAAGILTSRGGMTSHAAVIARGLGKPCVSGASDVIITENSVTIGGVTLHEGDIISIDGNTGKVYLDEVKCIDGTFPHELSQLLNIMNNSGMDVRANAETIIDINKALEFGVSGIGLCRTEHMLFEHTKIGLMQQIILQKSTHAIEQLQKIHTMDFVNIMELLNGRALTIRLFDPPLHEFMPHIADVHEINPMLGHRGIRLGITHPELYRMQIDSIFSAKKIVEKNGITSIVEIMVPFVSCESELITIKNMILESALCYKVRREDFLIGTMIELPRSCIVADQLAKHVDFFSFGTNDLTQTVYGLSRDDAAKFVPKYIEDGIFAEDPFVSIDQNGVGELMKIAIAKGKSQNSDLKIGVCGEHGGDLKSIQFFKTIGIDYVSCSPFRVPRAKIHAW